MRLFSRPGLVNDIEEFSIEMESYLISFLHDAAVGSVAGHGGRFGSPPLEYDGGLWIEMFKS